MHVCVTLKEDGPSVEREPPWVGVGGWRAVGEHFSDADGAAASLVGRSAGQKKALDAPCGPSFRFYSVGQMESLERGYLTQIGPRIDVEL